jgi:hypothetical protein
MDHQRLGRFATGVGMMGAWFIYALIWLLGRTYRRSEIEWLLGPMGGELIGDAAFRDVARTEGLTIERDAREGGLIPKFEALRGEGFEPSKTDSLIREFYEHTSAFSMDVWSETFFPSNIGLYLLVRTISRQVDQLNFPLSPLDTAYGVGSEIISLRRSDGSLRYTGWFRTLAQDRRALYAGFYMCDRAPLAPGPCVKAVFPMPRGNATVLLRPTLQADGSLVLDSCGTRFGEPGFYRVQARAGDRVRVWHVRTLKEQFHLYVDGRGVLRCDHSVKFLGLPVLRLHYKMFRDAPAAALSA